MAREFAPGIPAGRVIKSIPRVSPKSDNQEWDVSLSEHPAIIRGNHYDLRLVDPKGKAHSWALAKIPEPGKGTYAAQQATHSKAYALRNKPWSIPPGYGATAPGRMVEPVYVQKAEVVEASNNKVRFLRHHGQETDEFVLRKVREKGGKPLWALNNATKNRSTGEGQKLPSSKPKYKEIRPEQVVTSDVGEVMTPKFDGAHVLVDMKGPGRPLRVYSYRPTERKTGVIEHTFKFPDFHNRTTTNAAKNSMIRAELWGSKDGKAIPAEQLGGLLNAGVLRSRKMQQENGVQLRLTGIDVVKHHGRDYSNKTFDDKLRALREITRSSKGVIELPPVARTEEEKRRMLSDIETGRLPETKEGVVIHRVDGAAPPTKVKFKPQDDVYVREVFDKPRGKARGFAGGFGYSLTPDGPVVGRVGTGFDHRTRMDMLEHPENYVGRVAKVRSQGPFRSGALRSPSFDEWHIDKTPPELMKEGASSVSIGKITTDADAEQFLDRFNKLQKDVYTKGEIIAAKKGDEYVGGIVLKPGAGGRYQQKLYKKHGVKPGVTVSNFIVSPSERGKGIGGRLLAEATDGRGTVVLGTDNRGVYTDKAALHLYQNAGFRPIKRERRSTFWVKEAQAGSVLYHGSPARSDKLEPRQARKDTKMLPAVYGTPERTFALAYTGKWGDRDINQSTHFTKDNKLKRMELREMRPGAIDEAYKGRRGYVHVLPSDGFEPTPHKRSTAHWELINRNAVIPTEVEDLDALEALRADPKVRLIPYDAKSPGTAIAVRRSIKRMNKMDPSEREEYRKWRLEVAPPEIAEMFNRELAKSAQEKALDAVKGYKQKAVAGIAPDTVVRLGYLAGKRARGMGAINLVKDHLDEVRPGLVDKYQSQLKHGVKQDVSRAAGLVRNIGD